MKDTLLIAVLGSLLVFAPTPPDYQSRIESEIALASVAADGESPDVPPPTGFCPQCRGTGKVGDGRASVVCQKCGGEGVIGSSPTESEIQFLSPTDERIARLEKRVAELEAWSRKTVDWLNETRCRCPKDTSSRPPVDRTRSVLKTPIRIEPECEGGVCPIRSRFP